MNSDWQANWQQYCTGVPVVKVSVPPAARAWVDLTVSMTHTLAAVCGQTPRVHVLREGRDAIQGWEAELLQHSYSGRAATDDKTAWHVRHIALCPANSMQGQVCLVARSVVPDTGQLAEAIKGLGTQPLAQLLFAPQSDAQMQQLRPLQSNAGWFGRACRWHFARFDQSLLVEEYFAPEFIANYQPGG